MNRAATLQQSFTDNPIEVRKFEPVTSEVSEYYFDNDPFKTHFMNALSITFPEGERYFLRSVLAYRDEVSDPKLHEDIQQFCAQEAQHSLVHMKLNESPKRFGYPMDEIEGFVGKMLRARTESGKTSAAWRRYNLAVTVCLEHFTAVLANQVLKKPEVMFDGMDPAIRSLYQWHAVEEIEHRSVAFDVYKATGGSGLVLRLVMLTTSLMFLFGSLRITYILLRKRGNTKRLSTWISGFSYLFLPPQGMLFRVLPDWLTFFLPGFHPSKYHRDLDTTAVLQEVSQYLRPADNV
jgi:predicted metal-dependent hydrolase